jgi:Periplasmic binding protein/Receptor family ligand binding region
MFFLLLILLGGSSLSVNDTVLILSPSTPEGLSQELSDFSKRITITSTNVEIIIHSIIALDFKLLVDATMQPSLYQTLDEIASTANAGYLSLSPASANSYSNWRFNLHNRPPEESAAISKLIQYLNFNNFVILASTNKLNLDAANALYKSFSPITVNYIKYDQTISQIRSNDIVKSIIKSKGIKQIVIIDSEESFTQVQSSLQKFNLVRPGYIIISSSLSIYSVNIEGLLVVVESGLENASSFYNYHRLAILKVLDDLNNCINTFGISNIQTNTIAKLLAELYPTHITVDSYSIVNFYDNTKRIIGTINTNITINDTIYYPGNITTLTTSVSTALTISIANGTTEVGKTPYEYFAYCYEGARYAIEVSNLNNEIPGFHIELTPTDCGITIYDPDFYIKCYSKLLDKLGIAYMSSFWYSGSYGAYITLNQLGLTIPLISPFSQDNLVDNQTTMPYFLKLSTTQSIFYTTWFSFLKAMGWTSFVAMCGDDQGTYGLYLNIVEYATLAGLNIVNPVDTRVFPWNYTRDNFEDYKAAFQAIKDTGCRIFIINFYGYHQGHIWEGLYDIGLRRGDIILINDPFVFSYLQGDEEQYLLKRKELLYGSLVYNYKEYAGNLGLQIKKELAKLYDDILFMCLSYDTFSTIKEAINYILDRGNDYEDPVVLKNTMRNNKFMGCLGSVYFDTQSNSKISTVFLFTQIANNETTQTFYPFDLANVDMVSAKIIDIVNEFHWPLGSTTPSNFRDYNPCPFDSYQIMDSTKGKAALYSISVFFFCLSILVSILSYKVSKNSAKVLREPIILTFADRMFLLYFLFQFFQLIAMGPDQDSINSFINNPQNNPQYLLSFEFFMYFDLTFNRYWEFLFSLIGFSVVWVILCVMIILRCKPSFQTCFVYDWMKYLTDLILPMLGHIGFLPIFSMLMQIYLCEQAIGETLQDSFLKHDCTTFCYQGKHKTYTIISIIVTTLYLLTAIYCRPLWEQAQYSLNINTNAIYLSLLSVFQVTFVILNKTLKPYNQTIHGCVLSGLILLLLGLTIYIKPYNDKRVNAMQYTSLFLSFWVILTGSILGTYFNLEAKSIFEFAGLIVFIIIGIVVIGAHPTMLSSEKQKNISSLFTSHFGKNYYRNIRATSNLKFSVELNLTRIEPELHLYNKYILE